LPVNSRPGYKQLSLSMFIDLRFIAFIETVARDLRYAARLLRRDAAFTCLAALALGLGVGASTTVFSVVNAVLIKPLPYPGVERIVFPWRLPPPAFDVGFAEIPWGRVEFLTFERQTRTFAHTGAFLGAAFNLTGRGEPARLDGAKVSAGFFPALGVAPQLGRTFTAAEDLAGQDRVVVLSDRLWRDRFDADPSVVGTAIAIDGAPHIVCGVMPAGFAFPQAAGLPGGFTLPDRTALWVPLALSQGPRVRGEPAELAVIGRLADGATAGRAQAELDVFAAQMDRELPQAKGWFSSRVEPMTRQLSGDTRRPLLLLFAAVGVLLLIGCSNVANLLLTRSVTRARELTVRAALGAGRGRLLRQLLTESVMLAALGGALGVAFAIGGVAFARAFGPASVPRLAEVRIDPMVLAFAVAVSLTTGLVFGVAPAWSAVRDDLVPHIKDGGHRSFGGRRAGAMRRVLLVSQVALALLLLIASGLLARTFAHLTAADGGFDADRADRVLTFELTLPPSIYSSPERIVNLYRDALRNIQAVPGVEWAGIGETVPMGGAGESTGLRIPGRPANDASPPYANYTIVSPGYLSAIGTPILRGRDFAVTDTADSQPVAVINAAMARKYWPGQDAIGKPVGVPIRSFDMTIVGVVADVKHLSMREEPGPEIYVPYTQKPWPSMLTMHVAVRTRSAPAAVIASVRDAVRRVDAALPLARVTTLDAIVSDALARPRFSMLLVSAFGVSALVLACVGLYGAVSYSVTARTQEIGVRIALGAQRGDVLRLVLGQCVRTAALGIAAGAALSVVTLKLIASFLYGVEPTDPATFIALSTLLFAIALVAGYVPARRATRVDPLSAMRVD
jgi:predicted permease